jgi:hypothetical protein
VWIADVERLMPDNDLPWRLSAAAITQRQKDHREVRRKAARWTIRRSLEDARDEESGVQPKKQPTGTGESVRATLRRAVDEFKERDRQESDKSEGLDRVKQSLGLQDELPSASDASSPGGRAPPRLIKLPEKPPRGAVSGAAWKAMTSRWPNGVPENTKTAMVLRVVNAWIKSQPRALIGVDVVSREVVARFFRSPQVNGRLGTWAGK